MRLRHQEILIVLAILLLALLLRVHHMVGFGLGDDPYYAWICSEFLKNGLKGWTPDFGSNYRFGLWIPITTSFTLFGISDLSFVLFSLVPSVLLVAVVYLLGRELVDRQTGFFAALIQAVSSFDIAFATTMTIDLPTSFLLSLGVLLFLKAEKAQTAGNLSLNFLSAFAVIWAYFIKLPAACMMLVFTLLTLLRREHLKKHLSMYAFFGILLGATFLLDYWFNGDPLNYFHNEAKWAPKPSEFGALYLHYPRWLFTDRNWLGTYYYGFHFYLGALATVYCLLSGSSRKKALPFVVWWATTFLFLEFFPAEVKLPYKITPRFFRYAHMFVPSASLVAGVFLAAVWGKATNAGSRALGTNLGWALAKLPEVALAGLVLVYCYVSAAQGFRVAELYKDHYADTRAAAFQLASLPPKPIYSDNNMRNHFNFYTGYERQTQASGYLDGLHIQSEIVEKENLEPLRGLRDGYVVFGGSRGVDYANYAILKRGSFEPPANWKLIFEIDAPLNKFRMEPLRIYEVSQKRPAWKRSKRRANHR